VENLEIQNAQEADGCAASGAVNMAVQLAQALS
jgi:hypothetical protein